jgi:hypothetical protein
MRKPDPKYIVNLINQIVGKYLIYHITERFDLYPTVWRIYETVGPRIEQFLRGVTFEKLAQIIEYGNTSVAVDIPPIKRRERMSRIELAQCPFMTELSFTKNAVLNGLAGRELLERAALLSILVVIMDMTHQEEYRVDDELRSEELENEEIIRLHSFPCHRLYGNI